MIKIYWIGIVIIMVLPGCKSNTKKNDASSLSSDHGIMDMNPGSIDSGSVDLSKVDHPIPDIVIDGPVCECISKSTWSWEWQTCKGADVFWGCKHNPQKFPAMADVPTWCWTTEIDKATGCEKPKYICYGCNVPDMSIDLYKINDANQKGKQ